MLCFIQLFQTAIVTAGVPVIGAVGCPAAYGIVRAGQLHIMHNIRAADCDRILLCNMIVLHKLYLVCSGSHIANVIGRAVAGYGGFTDHLICTILFQANGDRIVFIANAGNGAADIRTHCRLREGVVDVNRIGVGVNRIPVAILHHLDTIDVCAYRQYKLRSIGTVQCRRDHLELHAVFLACLKGVRRIHLISILVKPDDAVGTGVDRIQLIPLGISSGCRVVRGLACLGGLKTIDHYRGDLLALAGESAIDPALGAPVTLPNLHFSHKAVDGAGGGILIIVIGIGKLVAILCDQVNIYQILVAGDKALVFVNPITLGQVKPADTVFNIIPLFICPVRIVIRVLIGIDGVSAAPDSGGVGRLFACDRLGDIVNDHILHNAVVAQAEFIVDGDIVIRIHTIGLMRFGIIAVDLCPDIRLTIIVGSHSREGISRFCLHFYSKLVIFTRYKRRVFINKFPIIHTVVGYKPKTV